MQEIDNESLKFDVRRLAAAMRDGEIDAYLKCAMQQLSDGEWASFVDATAKAHRNGDIDLAVGLDGLEGQPIGYATQCLIGAAIPSSGIGLADLLRLNAVASERSRGDGPSHWMQVAFREWCEVSSDNVAAALEEIRTGRAPSDLLHGVAHAGLAVDRPRFLPVVLAMLDGSARAERDTAAGVLGRITDFDAVDLKASIFALERALSHARDKDVTAPLRSLLAMAVREAGAEATGLLALDEVRSRADRHVRSAIVAELMFSLSKAPAELVRAAFVLLGDTAGEEADTIDGIDHILSQNLTGPLADRTGQLVDRLLAGGVTTMKQLDSYAHHLLAAGAEVVGATVMRWLLADTLALYRAPRDLCQAAHGEPLTFNLDFSAAALSAQRASNMARRSCAVLTLSPEAAASIIVGLIGTGPGDAVPKLAELLWNPLLINYWTGPRRYLERVLPSLSPPAAAAVAASIDRLDRHMAQVEAARDLAELKPSQHHRHLAALKRHEEEVAIETAAQERSVFASIFPMSIMLFGDSAVYDMVPELGRSVRQETRLAVHEFSIELPRLEVVDPFGAWYQRREMLRGGGDE